MTRRIACGHCHGHHASVAEARACSLENPLSDPTAPGTAPEPPAAATDIANDRTTSAGPRSPTTDHRPPATSHRPPASARRPPTARAIAAGPRAVDPAALAGPPSLGRSLIVDADDRSPVPAPWQGVPEVEAHADVGPEVVERLHRAWRQRQRLVIRWHGPLPDPEPILTTIFHRLDVGQELPGERLAFAVTANAIDARGDRPSFGPLSTALALGAERVDEPADGRATKPTTADDRTKGDVTVGRRRVWVDGGPTDAGLANFLDLPLVPRVHLQTGSLASIAATRGPAADLAPDQLAAVGHRSGPARILAPAGSGKTRVLTERARHLIDDCGVEARAVSLVAYNRRAKDEMRSRLDDIAGLDIRTLNSLALAVATGRGPFRPPKDAGRGAAGPPAPTTIDEPEARRILDRILPGRRRRALSDPLEPWIDALSACRLGLRDPNEVEAAYSGDVADFPAVLDRYRQELRRTGVIDFDEQILLAIERLLTDPAVRRAARAAVPILLIDEFQDLTPAHLLLLRLIAGPADEVFGVGDDDQTIYGYAGASPDWLIHFDRFFPGSVDHRLTINYRCPVDVVDAASNLLSHNRRRVVKATSAATGAEPTGLTLLTVGDPQDNLVTHVERLMGGDAVPTDIAVLTRVNAALLPAAIHLTEAGIPVVRPFGLTSDLLDRSGVGAAMSWLRLASGPARGFRAADLRLALRRPPRSLHPRVADWACEQDSIRQLVALSERLNTEREAETVAAFAADIESLRSRAEGGAPTEALLIHIYDEIGLLGAASQLDRSQRTARRAAHADELAALMAVARLHPDPTTFDRWLRSAIDAIPPWDPDDPPMGVTLATIHTTKGLEWPHVVVHDVRDGLYPHRLAEDGEEERRIFHVGVTRGRRSVAVTVSGPPSPFVAELATARPPGQSWPEEPSLFAESTAEPASSGAESRTARRRADRVEPASATEAALRDALTTWRRERSNADAVPAYVVLDNKTLDAIARVAPESLLALGAISGIGPAKLERYGADILGIVASATVD